MFFYTIHSIPWGKDMPNGKRNTRTFLFGSILYILTFALLFSKYAKITSPILYYFKDWFPYVLAADAAAMAVTYKLYYGNTILNEMDAIGLKSKADDYVPTNLEDHENLTNAQLSKELDKVKDPMIEEDYDSDESEQDNS